TDIYSLGATFYHLLTGQPPFSGGNNKDIILARLRIDPVPPRALRPDLSAKTSGLIMEMMARNPEQRPQNPAELLEKLVELGVDMLSAGDAVGAIQKSQSTRIAKKVSRKTTRHTNRVSRSAKTGGKSSSKKIWLLGGIVFVVLLLVFGIIELVG
ncbi:MAG: hypothetical protein JXR97_05825, partial [Planctomycetes bacterium]|nr:hypothetical protein [Planctomycetota bacterium]